MILKNWSDARPPIFESDKPVIQVLGEVSPIIEQILVTGELDIRRIGDIGLSLCIGCNNVLADPLFAITERGTIRMTRFQNHLYLPQEYRAIVWKQIPEKRLIELFINECKRLGVKYWTRDTNDFYSGIFEANKMWGKYIQTSNKLIQNYVNACLLFKKPYAHFNTPESFFSTFSFDSIELMDLTEEEKEALQRCHNPDVVNITNEECEFLFSLDEAKIFSANL